MSKLLKGVVVSTKMHKTAIIEVFSFRKHPLYRKIIKSSNRIKAENLLSINVSDNVLIEQTRPLSKDKHYKVVKVIK